MPRYFFTIRGRDRVEDDPDGIDLPDAAAALSHAEHIIRELRKKSGYNDLALMMFVTDQSGRTVLSLPFFPGCIPFARDEARRISPACRNWCERRDLQFCRSRLRATASAPPWSVDHSPYSRKPHRN